MAYLALYRKYRSRTFDELAGQEFIVKTLQNSLKNGEISHAYLFCGPRGTGKTSMARLFAKALNCETGVGNICNECSNCQMINDGSHPDIVEIDAASNSSVEQIRTLIEKIKYSPIKGKYKVYIIDEVHMLSNSAFNALLKTLEEPPADVVFILATTEPHKILPTIISRCQRYDFSKISDLDIKNRLLEIMDQENITCDIDALNEIIKLSDGCMRDALSILDQLVAFTNKEIHYSDLLKVFGLVSLSSQKEFLKAIFKGEMEVAIEKYHEYVSGGADILRLNTNFIDDLKDVLIFATTGNKNLLQRFPLDYVVELKEIADLSYLSELINLFMNANSELKLASNISSAYEVTLIRAFFLKNDVKVVEKKVEVEEKVVKEEIKVPETPKFEEPVKEEPIKKEIIDEEPIVENPAEPLPFMTQEEETKEIPEQKEEPKPEIKEIKKEEKKPERKISTYEDFLAKKQEEAGDTFRETVSDKENAKTIPVIEFDNEFLIKAIVKSTSAEKKELVAKLSNLDSIYVELFEEKFINLLRNCSVFTCSDELVILQSQFKSVIAQLNSQSENKIVNGLVSKILGKEIRVYVISYQQASNLQTEFFNLRQINKLPNKASIGKLFK